jgi:hypothetical protein
MRGENIDSRIEARRMLHNGFEGDGACTAGLPKPSAFRNDERGLLRTICRPWGLLHGPVLFAPGFISCLLSRTSPLGLVRAHFSI